MTNWPKTRGITAALSMHVDDKAICVGSCLKTELMLLQTTGVEFFMMLMIQLKKGCSGGTKMGDVRNWNNSVTVHKGYMWHWVCCSLLQWQDQENGDRKVLLYLFSTRSYARASQVSKSIIQMLFCTAIPQKLSLFILCLLHDGITLKVNKQ